VLASTLVPTSCCSYPDTDGYEQPKGGRSRRGHHAVRVFCRSPSEAGSELASRRRHVAGWRTSSSRPSSTLTSPRGGCRRSWPCGWGSTTACGQSRQRGQGSSGRSPRSPTDVRDPLALHGSRVTSPRARTRSGRDDAPLPTPRGWVPPMPYPSMLWVSHRPAGSVTTTEMQRTRLSDTPRSAQFDLGAQLEHVDHISVHLARELARVRREAGEREEHPKSGE
jgi:hypothetical protein